MRGFKFQFNGIGSKVHRAQRDRIQGPNTTHEQELECWNDFHEATAVNSFITALYDQHIVCSCSAHVLTANFCHRCCWIRGSLRAVLKGIELFSWWGGNIEENQKAVVLFIHQETFISAVRAQYPHSVEHVSIRIQWEEVQSAKRNRFTIGEGSECLFEFDINNRL